MSTDQTDSIMGPINLTNQDVERMFEEGISIGGWHICTDNRYNHVCIQDDVKSIRFKMYHKNKYRGKAVYGSVTELCSDIPGPPIYNSQRSGVEYLIITAGFIPLYGDLLPQIGLILS